MLSKIFNSGTSKGQSPVNYLLGDKDHTGKIRSVKPEVISGDPELTAVSYTHLDVYKRQI